jgi:tRNA threonylcarbamoyl adenosine modification protein YjeE
VNLEELVKALEAEMEVAAETWTSSGRPFSGRALRAPLARAIARGAGVEGAMPSPTFNLLFRYPARDGGEVAHLDLYRLRDPEELWELGWEELGQGAEIVMVEWPERAGEHLPADRWDIHLLAPEPGSSLRMVQIHRVGAPPHLPGFPVTLERG